MFDSFVEYLRDRYNVTRYIPEEQEWPPNHSKCHVNLAMMHHEGLGIQEDIMLTEQRQKAGPVAIDKITKAALVTKNIADIFITDPQHRSDVKFPQTVLIEGAPGIGKTILLKEIAYYWANGTLLKEAKILFLVYLRDINFQSVGTIKELVEYFYYLEDDEVIAVRKCLKQLNGEGVVFLIDGLDEYPDALQNCFLTDLVYHRILSKSVIVVTSRPIASLALHDKADRRVEVLGFGSADCDKYITESLKSSPEKRSAFDKYFKQNPLLNALIFIPFHLSVILFLFKQGYMPKTLTELNKLFVLHTVYRHLQKYGNSTSKNLSSPIQEIDELPEPICKIVDKLAELAVIGLYKDRIIFTLDDVKQICPEINIIPGAVNGFGLIQAVQYYPKGKVGKSISFSFLHLTMQEFMAAKFISQCSTTIQKDLLFSLVKQQSGQVKESIAKMWQMYFGIVGVDSPAWSQFTVEHKFSLADYKFFGTEFLFYFQCLVEGASKEVCDAISPFERDDRIYLPLIGGCPFMPVVNVMSPYYIGLLCSFISVSNKEWIDYDFDFSCMADDSFAVLANFLLASTDKLNCMESLDLTSSGLTSNSAIAIGNIIQEGKLVWLILKNNSLGESGINAISAALQINSTLRVLDLSGNDIGPDGAQALATALQCNCMLESLLIGNNKMLDIGCIAIGEALLTNRMLQLLDVSENYITALPGRIFAAVFVRNSAFQMLKINKECVPVIKQYSKLSFFHARFWCYRETNVIDLDSPRCWFFRRPFKRYDDPGEILSMVPLMPVLFPELFT